MGDTLAALGADVLDFSQLEGEATRFLHDAARGANLWFGLDAEEGDAGDTKAEGVEQQHHQGVAHFVQHDSGRVQPEPDEQAALAHEAVADLVNAPAQCLAR